MFPHWLPRLIAAVLATACAALHAKDEFREFTSNDGRTIEAKVTDYEPGNGVSIELRTGAEYEDVDLARFSKRDRAYIRKWHKARKAAKNDAPLKPDSRLRIFVKRGRDNDLNDVGDPDDREVKYQPALTIDNEEIDLSFRDVKGTLVIIGQSVLESDEYHILHREDFIIDLPANERVEWTGKSFINKFDDYAANGQAYGAEYEGYLLVLRDKEGTARIIKTSKTRWKRNYENILRADERQGHSKDFDRSFPKTST